MNTGILRFCLCAFAVGAVLMYASNRSVSAVRQRQRWIKFIVYFVILNTVLLLAGLGPRVFGWFALAIVVVGAWEISSALAVTPKSAGGLRVLIWVGYVAVSGGLLLFSFSSTSSQITFVYLVVAVFDGFSQVSGQLFGKHRLAPSVSPSKTAEGSFGGALAAMITALLFRGFINAARSRAIAVCSAIVLAALAGDLAASWVKRRCGVKDFGRLLPQHGGVLDRFDSFLVAAPASFLLLYSRL